MDRDRAVGAADAVLRSRNGGRAALCADSPRWERVEKVPDACRTLFHVSGRFGERFRVAGMRCRSRGVGLSGFYTFFLYLSYFSLSVLSETGRAYMRPENAGALLRERPGRSGGG